MSERQRGELNHNYGKKQTAESNAKRSAALKGRMPSPQTIEAGRIAAKLQVHSPERRQKNSIAHSKHWLVTNPDGDSQVVFNLATFCRENNLCAFRMQDVAYGRMRQHKGWLCSQLSEGKS